MADKQSVADYKREWASRNREKMRAYSRKHYRKNKDKKVKYYQENRAHILKYKNEWETKRREGDPTFRLRKRISNSVLCALKKLDSYKNGSTIDYLPYSIEELKGHLESQFEVWMNWDNWGIYSAETWDDNDQATWTWQIDHIVPQSELVYNSLSHPNFIKCWALENLRPISAKVNILKGSK